MEIKCIKLSKEKFNGLVKKLFEPIETIDDFIYNDDLPVNIKEAEEFFNIQINILSGNSNLYKTYPYFSFYSDDVVGNKKNYLRVLLTCFDYENNNLTFDCVKPISRGYYIEDGLYYFKN